MDLPGIGDCHRFDSAWLELPVITRVAEAAPSAKLISISRRMEFISRLFLPVRKCAGVACGLKDTPFVHVDFAGKQSVP